MVQEGAQFRYNLEEFDVPTRMAILDDLDKFDAEFFTLHAKQAGALDSRIKLLLETTYEAIVDAGINPIEIQGSRTGVFVGGADSSAQAVMSRCATPDKINKYGLLGNVGSMFSNRLSYTFNLTGPSYSVDAACASSSVALHQALQSIRAGSCDAAIVASGTTHHDPLTSQCFHQLKMTSADGKCKPFDASADGYVRAEAAVALYICKRQVARRVYGTLVHSTTNNDGYKEEGITYPSQHLQEKVMRELYKDTGISPLEVDYIEAHGTGTKVGDPQELAAITNVFCDDRKDPLLIGSNCCWKLPTRLLSTQGLTIQGSKTGVVGGADSSAQGILSRSATPDKVNKYVALGNAGSMFSNRISYAFNLVGPSYSIDAACSSSSVALHQALQAIRAGYCDAAIVATDGYVRAEATVAIYICKRQVARRVYSTLVHSTTNNDGYKEEGITYPSQHLQGKVMQQLYKDTGISPLEVDYIEAHGAGTKVGDPQELAAITNVFCDGRKYPLPIGSVKTNMGHSEHVSGLCGIVKVLLSHSAGQLPANLHYNTPNADIPSLLDGRLTVIDTLQPFNARYVAFNSMGFGGTNVHVLSGPPRRQNNLDSIYSFNITWIWPNARSCRVGATTPNISSMLRWDHSESYNVVHHSMEISRQKGIKFVFNLSNQEDSFLEGHTVDGKHLFPATGYVWLVWKCFAQQSRSRFENFPVVLENIRFERMTLLNASKDTELVVNIFSGSGKFEISESDSIVCSGLVRNIDNTVEHEMINYQICKDVKISGPCLNKEDFYKEMHLRGYGHSGLFQGIEGAHAGGIWAKVRWQGEWVSFIDAILQATLLRNATRDLYVPLRIQKLTINPNEIMEHLAASDSIIDVKSWEELGTKTAALESSVEIALDNLSVRKLVFTEILQTPSNMLGQHVINKAALKFPIVDFCLVNNSNEAVEEEHIATAMSRVVTMDDIDKVEQSILYVDDSNIIPNVIKTLRQDGFILYKGYSGKALSYAELTVISEKPFQVEATECCYYWLRKLNPLPYLTLTIINVDTKGYSWVETAKTSLEALVETDVIYFISKCYKSGINGFAKCLTREYASVRLRCFHAIESVDLDIRQPSENLKNQLQKDLVFNTFKNNAWGTFCNLSIPKEEFLKQTYSSIAYANALTLGDLSSLSWIESPLKMERKDLVEVYYSALNFKDVMLASGKIAQDSVAKYDRPDCIIGLEFSGVFQNRRVCGMGLSECLATRIDPRNKTIFDIPDSWSFEDAATVPCVYITVYLALILRGKMQPGESVLIHAGSGGVGQAAIQVALSMNCRVFTTVGTKAKREFLKARFPVLTDDCFTNSREARQFECHIKTCTNGRGVDLVLNSLAQDKIHASIRCLATNGRFLEIGKFDVLNDTKIGMSILAKGI
ncbi:unnamed protein product, partial [Allacma fusca]